MPIFNFKGPMIDKLQSGDITQVFIDGSQRCWPNQKMKFYVAKAAQQSEPIAAPVRCSAAYPVTIRTDDIVVPEGMEDTPEAVASRCGFDSFLSFRNWVTDTFGPLPISGYVYRWGTP